MPRINEPPVSRIDEGRYGRAIRAAAYVGAAMGAAFGLAITAVAIWKLGTNVSDSARMLSGAIASPIIFGLFGCALGIAVLSAVAPTSYLESRAARNWMNIIGTQTVAGARVVCLLVSVIMLALLAVTTWFLLTKLIAEPLPG